MSLGVLNNISAIYAQTNLNQTQQSLQNTLTQLSSGSRINSGADDAAGLALADGLSDADHGDLDQICGRALERSVDGGALGKAALVGVLAVDVGNGAHAAEERLDFQIAAGFLESLVDELSHPGVLFKITFDELLGFGGGDAEVLRQSEGRKAINDPEVHHIRLTAMVGSNHQRGNAKYLRGGEGMNVVAPPVSVDQQRIPRKMRQQPQFDL